MDFSINQPVSSFLPGALFSWNDAWIVNNGERLSSSYAEYKEQGHNRLFDWKGIVLEISFKSNEIFTVSVVNGTATDINLSEVVPFEFLLSGEDWYSDLNPQCESLKYWTHPLERQDGNAGLKKWEMQGINDISWWMFSMHETALKRNVLFGVTEPPSCFVRFDLSGVVWSYHAPQARIALRCLTFAGNNGVILKAGEKLQLGTFASLVSDSGAEIFQKYRDILSRGNAVSSLADKKALSGWCDWYQFYGSTDNKSAMENLDAAECLMKPYGAELFMQDEGWSKTNNKKFNVEGIDLEWEPNSKFPDGMKRYADKVTAKGLKPGLWVRPFIVDELSPLRKEDWVYADRRIDITHPRALDYLASIIKKIKAWGFQYLKYDYLAFDVMHVYNCLDYPADMVPYRPYDARVTTAAAYRKALEVMRNAAGDDLYILGCNTYGPLGWGIHNAQRTGDDVTAKSWQRTLATGIQAIASQWFLNGAVYACDPDCLMVHEPLSLNAARAFAVLTAITGHASIFSDDMPTLGDERAEVLKKAIPVIPDSAVPLDMFENTLPEIWWLAQNKNASGIDGGVLALFNWNAEEKNINVDITALGLIPGCEMFDIIEEKYCGSCDRDITVNFPTDVYCRLIAIRPRSGIPMVLGSDRHYANLHQEIEKVLWDDRHLTIQTTGLPCRGTYKLFISHKDFIPIDRADETDKNSIFALDVLPSTEYRLEFDRRQ